MKTLNTFLLLAVCTITLSSQSSRISVFLDCQTGCHMNYIKEQITFVDYMQDRQIADVYILATSQRTGAGGREVQLRFDGKIDCGEIKDTIRYMVDPNATFAIERDQMVDNLKRGLLRFVLETDLINSINYSIEENALEESSSEISDPWNYWVFNVGGNGNVEGEESYSRVRLRGRFEANRITDKNKFSLSTRYEHNQNTFTLTNGEEFTSVFKTYNLYMEYVKSITDHWSVGGMSRSGSSTFGNTDVSSTFRAAIEYNIFPYSEAQTRRFSFFYSIGPEYYDYTDLTIYDKLSEWTMRHSLTIQYEQTQKWGNISFTFGTQQYFHDSRLYNAFFNPWINWQIFKGFSINLGGYVSFVNDRINIAKSDITDEDILLQIKQLDTDFSYYTWFGVNYRFGSNFNNFVNPRF